MTRTRLCVWIVVCLGFMGIVLCQSHTNFVQRRSASIHSGMRPPPKILTALSEIVINANENLTLICEADEPITWTYPKMNASMESSSMIELDFKPGKKLRYGAYLRMYSSSFDDTGFHYCQYNDTFDSSNPNASADIYVYVRDEENLFTHSDVYVINGHQHQTLIIPCKPTSPDVHVVLRHDHGELASSDNATGRFSYDKRYGFSLRNFNTADGHRYECTGSLKHNMQDLLIFVHFLPKTENAPKPYVNASSYGHVIGGKLELNCYFEREDTVAVGSSWVVPDVNGLRSERIRVTTTPFLKDGQPSNREMTISTLTIEETTFDDSGIYTCVTRDHNNNMNNDSIEIKILEQGTSYINLTESTNQYTLDVTDEIGTVQWKVDVDAYPPVTLQWYDNNMQRIVPHTGWPEDMMMAKYSVRSTKKETILKITRVSVEDNGVYQLKASNDVNETTKNFTLRVSAKPLVEIQEKEDYHMVNRSTIIKCLIIAYPKPEVRWYFKPCLHDTCGAKSLRKIDKAYYNSTWRDPQGFTMESILNITARESGEISCEAENKNGKDINTHQFLVTDVRRGCDVWHSNEGEPVAAGDNLTLVCGASKHNFTDSFYWYFQSNTETNKRIEKLYDVVKYGTMYSYRSNFTISNIGHKQSGTYECRNRDEHTPCSRVTVEVKDPKPPVFYKTNLNNSDLTMDVGQNLVLLCYVRGIPTPTITWKKNDKPWRTDKNSHIKFTENNQVVVFTFTKLEDEAKYSCVIGNRIARMEKYMNLRFKQSAKNDLTLIGSVVFFALVLLALVIFLVVKIRKERKLRRELTIAGLMHFEEGAVESLNPDLGVDDQADLLPYDKKWEFPREKLKLGKQLGSGAFGVVTKARAYGIVEEEDATTVAVKMVKRNADFIYIKALASELKIMVHLGKHLNVVNLLGACTKNVTKRELFVIVEFCRYGNLHNYLLRHRDNFIDQIDPTTGVIDTSIGSEILSRTLSVSTTYSGKTDTEPTSPLVPPGGADYRAECTGRRLDSSSSCTADENISMVPSGDDVMITSANTVQPEWRSNYRGDYNGKVRPISTQDLLCWAFQVAHGMEYLASRRVLHGDLAARNILLADNNVVKICDFGLAKSMYKSDNYRKKGDGPLPVKWMAVESIRDRVFSTQSDVWSYGIVLWEFFSLARTPYPGMEADERFYNKLVEGYRMEQPDYATKQIYQIMLECWNARPVQRPSFTDLVVKIGGALEDSVRMHYIDLNNPYLDMNDQTAENGHSDYLAMLSPPDYGNLVSPTYVNNPSIQGDDEDDDDGGEGGSGGGAGGGDSSGGYLCMRPTPAPSAEIFSPRQTNVFNFDRVDGAKDPTPTSNGRPNDVAAVAAVAQTQRPTVQTSYSNPSYQFAPKIDEFAKEKGLSTGQDNYINVAKCKDAMMSDETSYKNVDPLASNHYVNDLKV